LRRREGGRDGKPALRPCANVLHHLPHGTITAEPKQLLGAVVTVGITATKDIELSYNAYVIGK
jgi:hypothetical protein